MWSGGPSTADSANACPTCDLLRDQYAEHDAWVESLKASAEAVLATHQRARKELDELLPKGATESSGDGYTGDSSN